MLGNRRRGHKEVRAMRSHRTSTVPKHIVESLDASLADIAAGRLADADAVQAEARRLLADHEAKRSSGHAPKQPTRAA
jgi:hypothetical protein